MRAALRRRRGSGGRSTQNYTHTHTQRERQEENNPERARGWSRGRESGGRRRSLGKKRINIDRFWKVRRRGRRTAICSRSQDARWGKKKKKHSGKA